MQSNARNAHNARIDVHRFYPCVLAVCVACVGWKPALTVLLLYQVDYYVSVRMDLIYVEL